MTDPLLYTPADVARILHVGRTTVYSLFADGALPSVKIGAVRRVRRSDLEAYVDGLAA